MLLIYNRIKLLCYRDKADIILLNQDRTAEFNGKEVNIHIYPVAKILSERYRILLINQSYESIPDNDIKSINVVPTNIFLYIKTNFVLYNKKEKYELNKIQNIIKEKFNLEIDVIKLAKKIYAYKILYREKKFRYLFRRFSNKIFFYYSDGSCQGIIKAAKDLEVKTIELQHSLVSALDIRYRLPLDIRACESTPDIIFTYGDYWNSIYSLPSERISVGFNYFDELYSQHYTSKRKQELKSVIIYSGIFSNKKFQTLLDDLSIMLPDKTFYFKLRKEEYANWRNYYPSYLRERKNIVFIDNNDKPIYSYINNCKWQIGVDSTLIYEGLAFGLTTIIYKTGWYEQMKPLYDNDLAFLISDSSEISEIINSERQHKNTINKELLFKTGSKSNILYNINKIINR